MPGGNVPALAPVKKKASPSDPRLPGPLSGSSAQGLADYWAVYSRCYDQVLAEIMDFVAGHPEFGPILRSMPPEMVAARNEKTRLLLERAVAGDWTPYDEDMKEQGAAYAKLGVTFGGWYEILRMVQWPLRPRLVEAYVRTPERLVGALESMQALVDRAMLMVGSQYLDTKQGLLVAQRELAEQRSLELAQAEARASAMLQSALDCIISMDHTGAIIDFNPAAERTFGYAFAGAAGKKLADLIVPPSLREAHRRGLERYLATGEGPVLGKRIEISAMRADGSIFPVELAITRVLVEGPPVFTAYLRDLTERKRHEEIQIRSLEMQAENLRALEAARLKSEFLANMSHELRTPLNAIIGFAELMHDEIAGPVSTEQRSFLGDIASSGRHLLELINDILDLSTVESGKMEFHPERVELGPLIADVASILGAAAAAKDIDVRVSVDGEVGSVIADAIRLKQVLYNYLSNAVKFTSGGGKVDVRARPEGVDRFRIEVEDTGIGIKPEDLGRLFDSFLQLDSGLTRRHAGTGLGLAVTKGLVEAQGGEVGVRSEFGKGSVFYATLPRVGSANRSR
jgi:PAS domain S-box-containing protein